MNKFDHLKDDDSGDHDDPASQIEMDQCDSDSAQNSFRRKPTSPGAGEHPLQYNYTFWYSRRTPSRPANTQSYEQNIKHIGSVASVEQFWKFYSHLVRPGDLTGHSDFHIFKEGIKPMWEVRDQQRERSLPDASHAYQGWNNSLLLLLLILKCCFLSAISPLAVFFLQEDILSIWNKTANDQVTTSRIRDTLRRVLNLPPNTIMEYKTHNDSLK
ncbi:eukaryotic translation initiation factor 4E type 2-like isoform X2 [Huso huso]|uniref:Eukaryotic translation initiation factor 4E type 2-like isoform X2 n=1 Tax=Huso huso TaxID=61971 RepID=A0ABR0YZU9_HUSHU